MKDKLKALLITSGLFTISAGVVYSAIHWPNEFFTVLGTGTAIGIFAIVYKEVFNTIKDENN